MEIPRFDVYGQAEHSVDGTLVDYDDHKAIVAEKDKEIERLKASEKKAFWNAFERSRMNPTDFDILSNWNQYKKLTEEARG